MALDFGKLVNSIHNSEDVKALRTARKYHHSSTSTTTTTSSSSSASKYEKLAQTLAVTSTAVGTATSLFQTVGAFKQLSKNNNGTAGAIDKLANTVGASEIADAQQGITNVDQAIQNYRQNGDRSGLEKCAQDEATCTAQANTIEKMTAEPQKAYDTANGELTKANETYKTDKTALETAQKNEDTAEKSYNTAADNYTAAEKDYASLQKQVAAMPAEQQAAYTTQLAEAKAKVEKANKAKTEAHKNWDDKKVARKKASDTVDADEQNIKTLTEKVKTAKTQLAAAQKSQATARATNAKWSQAIQRAKAELTSGGYTVSNPSSDSKTGSKLNITDKTTTGNNDLSPIAPTDNNASIYTSYWSSKK